MNTQRFSGTQDGSEILRVLQGVEDEDEGLFSPVMSNFEDIEKIYIRIIIGFSYDPLMSRVDLIKAGPGDAIDPDGLLVGNLEDIREPPFLLRSVCDQNLVEMSATGLQSFINCVSGKEVFVCHPSESTPPPDRAILTVFYFDAHGQQLVPDEIRESP